MIGRTVAFLKRSFLFSITYSSLLYILVRVIFFDFPFSTDEAFELFIKILAVVWSFITGCKLIFSGIVWLENNMHEFHYQRVVHLPAFRACILVMLTTIIGFAGKAIVKDSPKNTDAVNKSIDDSCGNPGSGFVFRLPY
jgi:hypothetical protein